jgi:hypothetical protein
MNRVHSAVAGDRVIIVLVRGHPQDSEDEDNEDEDKRHEDEEEDEEEDKGEGYSA